MEYWFNLVISLFTLELNCSHEGYFEGVKFVVFGDCFFLLRGFARVTGITLYHSWSSVDLLALKLRALCRPGEVRGFSDVAVSGRLGRQFHRKPPSRVWVVNVLFFAGDRSMIGGRRANLVMSKGIYLASVAEAVY